MVPQMTFGDLPAPARTTLAPGDRSLGDQCLLRRFLRSDRGNGEIRDTRAMRRGLAALGRITDRFHRTIHCSTRLIATPFSLVEKGDHIDRRAKRRTVFFEVNGVAG